jgi:hypothetical protein
MCLYLRHFSSELNPRRLPLDPRVLVANQGQLRQV